MRVFHLCLLAGLVSPLSRAQDPASLGPQRPPLFFDAARDQPGTLRVKFREGLTVRLREDVPRQLPSREPALDPALFTGEWRRTYDLPEARLRAFHAEAEAKLGRDVADHNLEFDFVFEVSEDHDAWIRRFHDHPLVEYALPMRRPAPLPSHRSGAVFAPPDYEPMQGYLDSATGGVGADDVRGYPGGWGQSVGIADLEYSWNLSHDDFPQVIHLGSPGEDPKKDENHGTAVLGELFAQVNGWGVTGLTPKAEAFVAPVNFASGYNLAGAILTCVANMNPGDIILIEQQQFGPNGEYVPSEWSLPVYNAIVTATAKGFTVVEAAGNGGENLDGPEFSKGNGEHWPFLPGNDSGAIIVGAGGSPGSKQGDRSRLDFSCYGGTVDLQGWGHNVYTTGYGNVYSAEGEDLWYTDSFNGTSSASPIVAGAAGLLQSVYRTDRGGKFLEARDVRDYLILAGSPQMDGENPKSENIGPRPDVAAALDYALREWVRFPYVGAEYGTFLRPRDTFDEGLKYVPDEGTVCIFNGADDWTGVVDKPCVIRAYGEGGSAVLGQ